MPEVEHDVGSFSCLHFPWGLGAHNLLAGLEPDDQPWRFGTVRDAAEKAQLGAAVFFIFRHFLRHGVCHGCPDERAWGLSRLLCPRLSRPTLASPLSGTARTRRHLRGLRHVPRHTVDQQQHPLAAATNTDSHQPLVSHRKLANRGTTPIVLSPPDGPVGLSRSQWRFSVSAL